MEWIETTGKTVDEAKERALDRLGVAADDAEFEVLEDAKVGLFGRVKVEARVRARVRPTQVRPKMDRRDRRRGEDRGEAKERNGNGRSNPKKRAADSAAGTNGGAENERGGADGTPRSDRRKNGARRPQRDAEAAVRSESTTQTKEKPMSTEFEQSGAPREDRRPRVDVDPAAVAAEAERFIAGLLNAFELTGTTEVERDGNDLEIRVQGDDLGIMIGPRGNTLLAIQDLVRVASQRRLGDHNTHLRIDIGGYRERRRAALARFTTEQAEQVLATGVARVLEPMPSADRKVVHDTIAAMDGVSSRSEGEDARRRVVITPTAG